MRRLLLFLLSHRALAIIRWDLHFLRVRSANSFGLGRNSIASKARGEGPKYLNLGSGPRGLASDDWINVDGWIDRNVDLAIDLNRPLPFENESFAGIFSEHVFEHFDLEQGESILRECLRVLKPGGTLRLIVPDGEKIIRTYLENPDELISRRGNGSPHAIDAVNSYFRQRYEHQYIYDWPMLKHQLDKTGFEQIRRVDFKQAIAANQIVLDDPKYAWESLYVEALKAGHPVQVA